MVKKKCFKNYPKTSQKWSKKKPLKQLQQLWTNANYFRLFSDCFSNHYRAECSHWFSPVRLCSAHSATLTSPCQQFTPQWNDFQHTHMHARTFCRAAATDIDLRASLTDVIHLLGSKTERSVFFFLPLPRITLSLLQVSTEASLHNDCLTTFIFLPCDCVSGCILEWDVPSNKTTERHHAHGLNWVTLLQAYVCVSILDNSLLTETHAQMVLLDFKHTKYTCRLK